MACCLEPSPPESLLPHCLCSLVGRIVFIDSTGHICPVWSPPRAVALKLHKICSGVAFNNWDFSQVSKWCCWSGSYTFKNYSLTARVREEGMRKSVFFTVVKDCEKTNQKYMTETKCDLQSPEYLLSGPLEQVCGPLTESRHLSRGCWVCQLF